MAKTEVYESNAEGLYIYHFNDDGEIDWAAKYISDNGDYVDQAVADFVGIEEQGIDPAKDGWEFGGYMDSDDPIEAAKNDYEQLNAGYPIASADYYTGSTSSYLLHDDPEEFSGLDAREFAKKLLGEDDED